MLPPPTIAKILENPCGEVVRDDGRNLDLRIRPNLPPWGRRCECGVNGARRVIVKSVAPFMNRLSVL
jgi:hypothetical protein